MINHDVDHFIENQLHNASPLLVLETLSFYNKLDLLNQKLKEYEAKSEPGLREWIKTYRLLYKRSRREIQPYQLFKAVQYQTSEHPDQFILYRMIQAYACYDLGEFGLLDRELELIQSEINAMTNATLKNYYEFRYRQVLANQYLRRFEIEQARAETTFIINECMNQNYIISAYHTLGISYLFESYENGIASLKKSFDLAIRKENRHQKIALLRTIIFYNNYWGMENHHVLYSNHASDQHEKAHREIRKSNHDKAKRILEKIDVQSLSTFRKGFFYFYQGLAYDSVDHFYQSMSLFKKMSDKFYANIPRIELYHRGERPSAIEAAFQ